MVPSLYLIIKAVSIIIKPHTKAPLNRYDELHNIIARHCLPGIPFAVRKKDSGQAGMTAKRICHLDSFGTAQDKLREGSLSGAKNFSLRSK